MRRVHRAPERTVLLLHRLRILGQNLGDVVGAALDVRAVPEKVEDPHGPVGSRRAHFCVRRHAAAQAHPWRPRCRCTRPMRPAAAHLTRPDLQRGHRATTPAPGSPTPQQRSRATLPCPYPYPYPYPDPPQRHHPIPGHANTNLFLALEREDHVRQRRTVRRAICADQHDVVAIQFLARHCLDQRRTLYQQLPCDKSPADRNSPCAEGLSPLWNHASWNASSPSATGQWKHLASNPLEAALQAAAVPPGSAPSCQCPRNEKYCNPQQTDAAFDIGFAKRKALFVRGISS